MSALSPRGKAGADVVLKLFDALLEKRIKPNTITYVSVIRAWGDKGAWQQAEKVLFISTTVLFFLRDGEPYCHTWYRYGSKHVTAY